MLRRMLTIFGAMTLWGVFAGDGLAQETRVWPEWPIDDYFRGSGYYLSLPKVLLCWLLFLCWVRTTDWVSTDAQIIRERVHLWVPLVVGTFSVSFLLVFALPAPLQSFLLVFPLMLVAYCVPLGAYIVVRNARVEEHEKVFTSDHLRHVMARWLKPLGVKIETAAVTPRERVYAAGLTAMGGQTKRDNDANLLLARQLPGFGAAGELLSDAASHRASVVWMDFTPELVSIRYQVDGVWHTNASQPRATCDPVLVVLKTISALDPEQRVAHQDGEFGFHFGGVDYKSEITSQGRRRVSASY